MPPASSHPPAVLITGAAGGLGQALVGAFLSEGWRVAAGYHRTPVPITHPGLWPVELDVTRRDHATRAVAGLLERWGQLHVLVHAAGITVDQLSWQITDADWGAVLEVNLRSAFVCAQAVLPAMIRQQDGHLLNIASFAGRVGSRGQAAYAAAKSGLLGLTLALAREHGRHNVRANAILPGVLPTPMTASVGGKRLAEFAAANSLGRLNSLEEVARFVVFLAATRNISGQVFQLDSRPAPWT